MSEYILLSEIAANPDNPREKLFNKSLVESIKEIGLQDPITVRQVKLTKDPPKYEIIDGDCRFDALGAIFPPNKKLVIGKDVIIKSNLSRDEAYDINVSLNLQRENYSLREECNIVQHYLEKDVSQVEIGKKCHRSRTWVQDRINFLKADNEIQVKILAGELNISYYREKQPASRSTPMVLDSESGLASPHAELTLKDGDVTSSSSQESTTNELLETSPVTLQLSKKEFIFFEKNFHHLCSRYNDLEDGKEIIFLDTKAYSDFHHAAQTLVTKEEFKDISDRFQNRFTLITTLPNDSTSIFWLDPQTRLEFEKSRERLTEDFQKDSLIRLRSSHQITEKDFAYLQENFSESQYDILNKWSIDNLLGVTIQWFNEDDKNIFTAFLKKEHELLSKKKESKETEKDREVIFTDTQLSAYRQDNDQLIFKEKLFNKRVRVVLKTIFDKMNAIKFILDHADDYPLTQEQYALYTDLTPKEISAKLLDFKCFSQDTYLIKREIRDNKNLQEFLASLGSSKILFERESFDNHVLLDIAWENETSKKAFEDFLAEEKAKLQEQKLGQLTKDELKEFNISTVSLDDLDLIKAVFKEYVGFTILTEAETDRGFRKIRWNEIPLKLEYNSWTDEKRDELTLKFLDKEIKSIIRNDVYEKFLETNEPAIIREEKRKGSTKVFFKTKSDRKKYYAWLEKNLKQFINLAIIDTSEQYSLYRDLKDFTEDEISYRKRVLYFNNDRVYQNYLTKIYELDFEKFTLKKDELTALTKHLPELSQHYETKKEDKSYDLFTKDLEVLKTIKEFFEPSRKFSPSGFESLSYKDLFETSEINQIPIPIDVLKSDLYKENYFDHLETMRRFITEAYKKGDITIHTLELISHDFWTYRLENNLELEKSRRRIDHGQEQRLINCSDCKQDKWVSPGETICHSCQAGKLFCDMLKTTKQKEISATVNHLEAI